MACATCHDPAHGFSPSNDLAVQLGGKDMRQAGLRAVPSLTYLQAVPPFDEHFHDFDDEGDDSIDNGPTGGLTWDGRMDRGREQAAFPLTSPFEMANDSAAAAVARARQAGYDADLIAIFGADVFDDGNKAFAALTHALEVYEQSCARLLSLLEQIRRLSRRPRAAVAAGGARAQAVRGSAEGQLRELPHQPARQ